jgi:hypothetical protein
MMMTTISEFLMARLDEMEIAALNVQVVGIHDILVMDPVAKRWLERQSPAHVLLDIRAKRVIVTECAHELSRHGRTRSASACAPAGCALARYILITMAVPYADHPDFQPGWVL